MADAKRAKTTNLPLQRHMRVAEMLDKSSPIQRSILGLFARYYDATGNSNGLLLVGVHSADNAAKSTVVNGNVLMSITKNGRYLVVNHDTVIVSLSLSALLDQEEDIEIIINRHKTVKLTNPSPEDESTARRYYATKPATPHGAVQIQVTLPPEVEPLWEALRAWDSTRWSCSAPLPAP